MPVVVTDTPSPSCFLLLSGAEIEDFQQLGPDPSAPVARDARGRFAKGSSGNPRGRPRGIRNPKRRVPDLAGRRLGAQGLFDLLGRKPHLLRPLAAQLLPPPLAPVDPAERLGIAPSSLRTVEDFRQVLAFVLQATARGEIAPAEALCITRRARARLNAIGRRQPLDGHSRRRTLLSYASSGNEGVPRVEDCGHADPSAIG
ncbi:MAG: hypothetical protein JO320_02625 [Alphaproteobacteria bacterium]|nr:hypothetical protein [Alphaproteobacteria bacterium]MBV9373950.1 hypothetical protein [Alphaproteobacteria bacterium]